MLAKKNEETYERVLKGETVERFGEWYLKVLNFEALGRLRVVEEIW
jgi:hypothetical protein